MKVAAYHSIEQSDPDVHHNQSNCLSGQQILLSNKRNGTNGWPLCGLCSDM